MQYQCRNNWYLGMLLHYLKCRTRLAPTHWHGPSKPSHLEAMGQLFSSKKTKLKNELVPNSRYCGSQEAGNWSGYLSEEIFRLVPARAARFPRFLRPRLLLILLQHNLRLHLKNKKPA